jgi:hypothetical protein
MPNQVEIKFPIQMAFEDREEGHYLAQILTRVTGRKIITEELLEPGPTTRTFYQFIFHVQ